MPLFRAFTGFASRIRSRAAKPATYENLWVFLRSDALVVRAGWNIRGCNPLSTPGFFDNLCGDGLLPPRSLCQSALPIVRATAFAEGLGGLSECEGHRLPPCNGPSFPARMPPVPEPLGDGGLRYPRWMAFCDCRRPPFSPALPVSTPTPPGWRSCRLLRRAFSSCRQSRSSPCGAVPLGIRFPALPMAQPPAEFPQKHVYAGPACLFPPFFRVAAASAAMACARVEIQYIGNRKKEQSLHRNGNIGTAGNQ